MGHLRSLLLASIVVGVAACSDDAVQPDSSPTPVADMSLRGLRVSGPEQVMPGEVIVKLKAGVDAQVIGTAHGLAFGSRGYKDAFVVLRGAVGAERANAAALRKDARVEYAEPNYLRQPTAAVDPKLWAFYNPGGLNMKFTTGKSKGLPLPSSYASTLDSDEDAALSGQAGSYGTGGGSVVIGSIDTGVDSDHPEFLANQLIKGKDWYNNDNDPEDDDGHGTHTTGTMVGKNVGIAGVSGAGANIRVYVQKVCGRRGCPTTAIVNAIRAAADFGVVAMNLSLGGSSESQAEKDAIAYAGTKNALVIASAGNDGTTTISCPACDPNAISVAALTWSSALAPYSNSGSGLDISAPGGSCYSNTTPDGCIYSAFLGGGYEWEQGTSMAAPQVTGTAGVVASKNPSLRGASLRTRLLGTADPIGPANTFGAGRLNTYKAVTNTAAGTGE